MKTMRGDTIVEVLLAMSVVGIVLGAAFGIANRSIALGQDAQERTEALKIAESQLELFRSQYPVDSSLRARLDNQAFCFDMTTPSPTVLDATNAKCKDKNPLGAEGFFTIVITPPGIADPTGSYSFEVNWERIGRSAAGERNSLSLYFKPGKL